MELKVFDTDQWLQALEKESHTLLKAGSLAFYSSAVGGITKNPALMSINIEDHMVHRGDAVFEVFKVIDGRYYLLDEHLRRMQRSADRIDLKMPFQDAEFKQIIRKVYEASEAPNVLMRLFVARGPGGYTTNPYECPKSQLYVVSTQYKAPPEEKYQKGVSAGRSSVPVKNSWFPLVKSCNYLANVLMKKEAVDRGLDFVISFDDEGFVAESSTENVVIVDKHGELVHPRLNRCILDGTTMLRAFELARKKGLKVGSRDLTETDLREAREVMVIGTTLDVMPVSKYENETFPIGPIATQLRQWILEDQ